MVEKTHFFLQLVRKVFEVEFLDDILLLHSLNVEKAVLAVCEHFRGVIKVNSNHVVAQGIPNSVLRRVVNPFLDCYIYTLYLNYSFSRGFLFIAFSIFFQNSLTFGSADIFLVRFINGVGSIGC